MPVEAIAGAQILHLWFPLQVWQIGLVLMAIMTAVNLLSARSYGEFEFWFSSIKVAAIIAFILVAAAFAFGLTSPQGATLANLTAHGGFAPKGWVPVLAASRPSSSPWSARKSPPSPRRSPRTPRGP